MSDGRKPRARTSGLVVNALADEVLVYDLARAQAHRLNRVAARVWRQCDGTRTLAEIAAASVADAGAALTPETVAYALAELARAHLLAGPAPSGPRLTRRELLQRAGGAAAAVPLVASIVAPTAADAASCVAPDQQGCSSLGDCCPCPPGQLTDCIGTTCVCSSLSDRDAKEGFAAVDPEAVLARLAALPLETWRYRGEAPGVRHLGPMAQDFAAAFGLGADDRRIHAVDASGVALAAIQGLQRLVQAQARQLEALAAEVASLRAARAESRPA
jgi:hypothetical protein